MLFLLLVVMFINSLMFGEETSASPLEKMDQYVEKVEKKWKYNPFRQTDNEQNMVGLSDPRAFITRFTIGAMPSLTTAFPSSTGMHADQIGIAMAPTIATEFNVIPFEIGRVKTHIGIAVKAEFHLFLYNKPYMLYGRNYILSDAINVAPYVDIIIDDSWKVRWLPIVHYCSHATGDFLGDPNVSHPISGILDAGQENMVFELYYARSMFTVYGGINFNLQGIKNGHFGTLFATYAGIDVRVPIWGKLKYVASLYAGVEVNMMNEGTKVRDPNTGFVSSEIHKFNKVVDPAVSVGTGFQIDRYTLMFRYSRYRSQHITLYQAMEERIGLEIGFYF